MRCGAVRSIGAVQCTRVVPPFFLEFPLRCHFFLLSILLSCVEEGSCQLPLRPKRHWFLLLSVDNQGVTIRGILACIMYYTYYYLLFVLCINIIEEFDFDRRQSRSQGV